jgi:BirA family biotin operon repressor/biotin-[acetyl-CoA-carboxylase] ligase
MISLDAAAIGELTSSATHEKLAQLQTFSEIDSTNSYLMQIPGPVPGKISIAATCNQTAGRGRHGKEWQSPPGSGVCLSAAYTFASQPENFPALTLALGLGAIAALQDLGASGVDIKWPNDLVARDGKLGGILTEVQAQSGGTVTVVTGIGINVDLADELDLDDRPDWAQSVVDLKDLCDPLPSLNEIAAQLTSHLLQSFVEFDADGFAIFSERWPQYDWLMGRELIVDSGQELISGTGAGIASDGALLVNTVEAGLRRVTSGSVIKAGERDASQ